MRPPKARRPIAFSKSKEIHFTSTGKFSLTASEHLTAMPVVLHVLETVVVSKAPNRLCAEINSSRALAAVTTLVKDGKLGGGDADRLRRACELRGKLHALAYPDAPQTQHKLHWLYHLPMQLARDGWLLDCFVGERSHSHVKPAAREAHSTASFEATLLKRLWSERMASLDKPDLFNDRLIKPTPCPEYGGVAAAAMVFQGATWAKKRHLHRG